MMNRGNIEEAYKIGLTLDGSCREVLNDWMNDVEDRLKFNHVMNQIRMHIERNLQLYDFC